MEKKRKRKAVFLANKRTFFSIIFSPVTLVVFIILLQVALIIFFINRYYDHISELLTFISVLDAVIIIRIFADKQSIPEFKLTWAAIVLGMPVVGTLIYLITDLDFGHKNLKRDLIKSINESKGIIIQRKELLDDLKMNHQDLYQLQNYICKSGDFDFSDCTDASYFSSGEDFFNDLLEELSNAEHFIFMEYFIIEEGEMWGEILNILETKAAEGVEVRILYDGFCDLVKLPYNYYRKLQQFGIKCHKFLPLIPLVSTYYNFRDHRKMTIIDNRVAYMSGANLADEYINLKSPFGYWKDSAIKISGEAVRNMTLMFLQLFDISDEKKDYDRWININRDMKLKKSEGYLIPFCEYPLDEYQTSERVYISLINEARRYVYIKTPYMVLDSELQRALEFAAVRGVDVRICFPGIPDKKLVYALGKTYYHSLTSAGVKIYEFIPGFMHSKEIITDDIKAVVGTVNLDYRSFYHHFECACYLYKMNCIADVRKDFEDVFRHSHLVTQQDISNMSLLTRLIGSFMAIISTMM